MQYLLDDYLTKSWRSAYSGFRRIDSTSAAARVGRGCIVYVFPLPVCPYAKQVACVALHHYFTGCRLS